MHAIQAKHIFGLIFTHNNSGAPYRARYRTSLDIMSISDHFIIFICTVHGEFAIVYHITIILIHGLNRYGPYVGSHVWWNSRSDLTHTE